MILRRGPVYLLLHGRVIGGYLPLSGSCMLSVDSIILTSSMPFMFPCAVQESGSAQALSKGHQEDVLGETLTEVPSSKRHLLFSGPPWLGPEFSALCLQWLCWILLCLPQKRTQLGAPGVGGSSPQRCAI